MIYEIPVLDRGYVRLIDSMGTDESIIEAARMSTGRGFEGWDEHERCVQCGTRRESHLSTTSEFPVTNSCVIAENQKWRKAGDAKLLEYLYANRHMTPFEMCELHIEVKAPIFVFREWMRHRSQSYNEFSARYSVMPNEHYLPEPERIQKQATANKQGSAEPLPLTTSEFILERLSEEQDMVYENYAQFVEMGIAKEVARINTPVSRYSKMRAKTDLRNWLAFLALRLEKSAQLEIRQYADAVATIIRNIWPRTFELFLEHDFFSARFSKREMKALRDLLEDEPKLVWKDFLSDSQIATFWDKTEDKQFGYPDLGRSKKRCRGSDCDELIEIEHTICNSCADRQGP